MEPSPVLSVMGVPRDIALGAVRFSLGRWSTREEIDSVVDLISKRGGQITLQAKT